MRGKKAERHKKHRRGRKNRYPLNDNLENVGKILYDYNNPLASVNRAKTNNNSSINWVYKSEIFSVTENKLFHEKISEINQGSQAFKKTLVMNICLQLAIKLFLLMEIMNHHI